MNGFMHPVQESVQQFTRMRTLGKHKKSRKDERESQRADGKRFTEHWRSIDERIKDRGALFLINTPS